MTPLLFALLMVDPTGVETILTLDALPEDNDLFLEKPVDLALSPTGVIYVLDIEAKRIFIFEKDGSFRKAFGSAGSAPGEFTFSGRRGSGSGFLAIHGDRLFVFDGARREVSVFGLADLRFQKALPFKTQRSRTTAFWAVDDSTFLFFQRAFSEKGPREKLRLLNSEGNELAVLMERELPGVGPRRRGQGRPRGPRQVEAYGPVSVVDYDTANKRIMVGHSETASLDIYSAKGKKSRSFAFKIPRLEITKEDKAEYNSQDRVTSGRWKPTFPEQKQFFERALSQDNRILVFNVSPVYRNMTGFVIDEKGSVKGRFAFNCGENGDLVGDAGRIFAIRTDNEGEFKIEEIRLKTKG